MAGADFGGGKGGRVSIYIDMTPMVDVIILLLIFFFMTSQFKEPHAVEVTLPKPTKPGAEEFVKVKESNVLTVKVDDAGDVFVIDTRNRGGKKVNLTELGEYIGSRQTENPELITIIDVSPKAKYSRMVDVLDEFKMAAEDTKVTKLSLRLEEIPETAASAASAPK